MERNYGSNNRPVKKQRSKDGGGRGSKPSRYLSIASLHKNNEDKNQDDSCGSYDDPSYKSLSIIKSFIDNQEDNINSESEEDSDL